MDIQTDEEFEDQLNLEGLRVSSEDSLSTLVLGDMTKSQVVANSYSNGW